MHLYFHPGNEIRKRNKKKFSGKGISEWGNTNAWNSSLQMWSPTSEGTKSAFKVEQQIVWEMLKKVRSECLEFWKYHLTISLVSGAVMVECKKGLLVELDLVRLLPLFDFGGVASSIRDFPGLVAYFCQFVWAPMEVDSTTGDFEDDESRDSFSLLSSTGMLTGVEGLGLIRFKALRAAWSSSEIAELRNQTKSSF